MHNNGLVQTVQAISVDKLRPYYYTGMLISVISFVNKSLQCNVQGKPFKVMVNINILVTFRAFLNNVNAR